MKITKDMTVSQVIAYDKNLAGIFMRHGMMCIGCPSATNESLQQAAAVHGLNLETLLNDLNVTQE
jgi:hybrid cluster-associated redox disulfide protein